MIGFEELLNHSPFKYDAIIEANSKVAIIDKSTLQELLQELPQLLEEISA